MPRLFDPELELETKEYARQQALPKSYAFKTCPGKFKYNYKSFIYLNNQSLYLSFN